MIFTNPVVKFILSMLLLMHQGPILPIPGVGGGIAAGTAPIIENVTLPLQCTGSGGGCSFPLSPHATGDTIMWIITSSAGNTDSPSSDQGESITCTGVHTYVDAANNVCYFLAANTNAHLITNPSSVSSYWNAGIMYDILCAESPASLCVIEQGPTWADTFGTGSPGTITAGSITTVHQLNELILGGFLNNNQSSTGTAMLQVSPFTIPGTAGCQGGAGCGQIDSANEATATFEYYNATSTGTYTASVTQALLKSSSGFTLALY